MIIKGTILDGDDIQITTRIGDGGESIKQCVFKLMTNKPSAIIDVKLSPEQINAGYADSLKKLEGDRLDYQVEYRAGSFGDNKTNMHRQFNGFRLFALPDSPKLK